MVGKKRKKKREKKDSHKLNHRSLKLISAMGLFQHAKPTTSLPTASPPSLITYVNIHSTDQ
jgi:hypothetical protein